MIVHINKDGMQQGCKWDLSLRDRDKPKTFSFLGPRRHRDQDLPAIPRDRHETETSDFCHETRPKPCKAETETFFETIKLQHCAKSMNGDVQIKSIYIKQYRSLTVSCTCIAINKYTCESVNNIDTLHSMMYVQFCNEAESCAYWLVNETLWYETETRPRHLIFSPKRDRDPRPSYVSTRPRRLETMSWDRLETEMPRPRLHHWDAGKDDTLWQITRQATTAN